ncbi:TPA: hypothetical protein N0F65_004340 [Lagenidium giganteum]|uniref:FYVE-type domain-containing protein n=1 Tax=Lagenidium giganteum TaxID=4803 RepID=A0AAV2YHW7_9STRA|nr:TPA: hypothetical protein N0F65_004340 [Lagenidium giganteum]
MTERVRVAFPLPKGYFGQVKLSLEQQVEYRQQARACVDRGLCAEREWITQGRTVDPREWKLAKKKRDLLLYRKASAKLVLGDGQPAMQCTGTIEGTLEDLIFGSYDKSHEEMKQTTSFVDEAIIDCTVLHTLESATPDDPFHYTGFKWALNQFPGSFVLRDRDFLYMESMGITTDDNGERYGYHIMESIELPDNCPPFTSNNVVRGHISFVFIYRQTQSSLVEMFAQGAFDPNGEMVEFIALLGTMDVLAAVYKTVLCSEAKKLTIMALDKDYFQHKRHRRASHNATLVAKTSEATNKCHVCHKTPKANLLGVVRRSPKLRPCDLCGGRACSKCRMTKKILMGPRNRLKMSCCWNCIVHAKHMRVKPAEVNLVEPSQSSVDRVLACCTGCSSASGSVCSDTPSSAHSSDSHCGFAKVGSVELLEPDIKLGLAQEQSRSNSVDFDDDSMVPALPPSKLNGPAVNNPPMYRSAGAAGNHKHELYQRMLELRLAAEDTYYMTCLNEELMRR